GFVALIGNYERGVSDMNAGVIENILTKTFDNEFYKSFNAIRDKITTKLRRNFVYNEQNGMYELNRSTKQNDQLTKTKYTLFKSDFFGTGNLSVSIILNLNYIKDGFSFVNTIAKIY